MLKWMILVSQGGSVTNNMFITTEIGKPIIRHRRHNHIHDYSSWERLWIEQEVTYDTAAPPQPDMIQVWGENPQSMSIITDLGILLDDKIKTRTRAWYCVYIEDELYVG